MVVPHPPPSSRMRCAQLAQILLGCIVHATVFVLLALFVMPADAKWYDMVTFTVVYALLWLCFCPQAFSCNEKAAANLPQLPSVI